MDICPHHVRQALENPDLAVRPAGLRVPDNLCGTSIEPVFRMLVRMNDGPEHLALKAAITAALRQFDGVEIQRISRDVSGQLIHAFPHPLRGSDLTHFCYALPICVIGTLLGYRQSAWKNLVADVLSLVRCIAPGTTVEQRDKGAVATTRLLSMIPENSPLMDSLRAEFAGHDLSQQQLRANILGLFFQSCEGTAGLIGQSLILASRSAMNASSLMDTILHISPPISNTRRFALRDTYAGHSPLKSGEMIVLSLEQGNAFGHGTHACPGEHWAKTIAVSGLSMLLVLSDIHHVTQHYRWRESQNARVPEFYTPEEAHS